MTLCGGASPAAAADQEIQTLIDTIRTELESKSGKNFTVYEAVTYRSQVVAGTNYFVKVKVNAAEFVHVRVFKPLPYTGAPPELHSFQVDKADADDLEYF